MAAQRTYLAIDLKSFYASVECVDRHLDPLTTNLVVADASRTEKTICLAVSPSLKAYKIPGRARLFEAVQRVREVNAQRLQTAIRQKKAVRGEDGKKIQSVADVDFADLRLLAYAPDGASYEYYTDDGETKDYDKPEHFVHITLDADGNAKSNRATVKVEG